MVAHISIVIASFLLYCLVDSNACYFYSPLLGSNLLPTCTQPLVVYSRYTVVKTGMSVNNVLLYLTVNRN